MYYIASLLATRTHSSSHVVHGVELQKGSLGLNYGSIINDHEGVLHILRIHQSIGLKFWKHSLLGMHFGCSCRSIDLLMSEFQFPIPGVVSSLENHQSKFSEATAFQKIRLNMMHNITSFGVRVPVPKVHKFEM